MARPETRVFLSVEQRERLKEAIRLIQERNDLEVTGTQITRLIFDEGMRVLAGRDWSLVAGKRA